MDHSGGRSVTEATDPRAEACANIVARYGSEAAALAPCDHERMLREGTWSHVMPGDPATGPSLMGWRDGPASTMQPEVRRDVSTAIPLPRTPDAIEAEVAYWTERAWIREALDAAPMPVWVRARRALLEDLLRGPRAPASQPPPVQQAAPVVPDPGADPAADQEAGAGSDEEASGETEAVQSGQPNRTREEAREAVRALLGKPLTDREIARRVGVSPSTVAAVRKATGA